MLSAELVGAFVGIVPGAIGAALLVLLLLAHYALRDAWPLRRLLPALALAPLLRLLSVIMPVNWVPQIYWYALVGLPLLIAVVFTTRLLGLPWSRIGLHGRSLPAQMLIALTGPLLSLPAFLILRPPPLDTHFDWRRLVVDALILLVFAGFLEEIIFRGLLQTVATEVFARWGTLCASLVFMFMYIGTLSFSYIVFIGLVGLFFGWSAKRTGSIWGVILAHSMLDMGMILVWPVVLVPVR